MGNLPELYPPLGMRRPLIDHELMTSTMGGAIALCNPAFLDWLRAAGYRHQGKIS